jgi:chemotaxis family two-component system sensor kinase Cph1
VVPVWERLMGFELKGAHASELHLGPSVAAPDPALAELNHRVANQLQMISSLLNIGRMQINDPVAKEFLTAAMVRVSAAAQLNRHLSQYDGNAPIELKQYLFELALTLSAGTGLQCRVEAVAVSVKAACAQKLAAVVTELVLNARKHAYDGRGGKVVIICKRSGGDRVRLSVCDFGRGLPEDFDFEKSGGLGMSIVASLARQLDGQLQAENDRGARFTLNIPLTC